MATCKEVHTSVYKGVTTVVRCDQRPDHGTCHSAVVAWYAHVPVPENWQPGDVVLESGFFWVMFIILRENWKKPNNATGRTKMLSRSTVMRCYRTF